MDTAVEAGASAPANDTAAPIDTALEAAPESAPDQGQSLDDSLNAVWDKYNPPRAADGKFASRDAAETTEQAATEQEAATETADQPETTPVEPAAPAINAPQSWSAEAKAKWAAVPPELQQVIAKRETESHQAITRLGMERNTLEKQIKEFEPINQLLAARKDDLARRGISPSQALATLFDAQARLDANPVDGLVQIGLSYGIDLRPVFAGQQTQVDVNNNPALAQIQQKLELLEQRNAQLEKIQSERQAAEQRAKEQAEAAEQTKLVQEIEEFKRDKPYFEEVRATMAALLQGGATDKLDQAYDMAVNAHPDIRQRIQADQRAKEEAARQEEARKKAEEARKAASVNVRTSQTQPAPKSWDDTLSAVADRMGLVA